MKESIFATGEVLVDKTCTGKERPWEQKKIASSLMAENFLAGGLIKKAQKIRDCANKLVFKTSGETLKLYQTWFCKVRLCPMCNWRRSIKIAYQNKRIVETVNEREKVEWVFLTLTVKNCSSESLSETVEGVYKGFKRLCNYKAFKKSVKGYFRALEITRDRDAHITKKRYEQNPGYFKRCGLSIGSENPNYGTYHPHFHVLLCVPRSYFKKKEYYIKQDQWTEMWQKAMKLDYKPIVDVRRVKAKKEIDREGLQDFEKELKKSIREQNAIFEVSKYPVKDTDVIKGDKVTDENIETVLDLDKALSFKRLIGYGGLLKEVHKELKFDDAESGDLVQVSESDEVANGIFEVTAYWQVGIKKYVIE
ncbi:protein rep [Niallia sp. FSL K6-0077]|jgi:plasmid rolling circle replication initiator protein Rep|uniref:protein rep n=1 Tax=Niallia sp. FSL K6-0077 TaxID=2954743 RepID=UPI0030F81A12